MPSHAPAPTPPYTLFAVCAPGLEPFTAQELGLLVSPSPVEPFQRERGPGGEGETGGLEFHGSLREMYLANLHLRTASRVLVRLGEFYAAAFSELRKKASRLAWENFLTPGQSVALRVTCHKSKLYHSDAVAERIAGAIEDRLGRLVAREKARGDDEPPAPLPQLIVARLVRDKCTLSVDSSGALLHQRGYRLATAKAPLRETLAAGMLLASGWDPAAPLLDPFCGSGTIPIEAALMARDIPPGLHRRFAFMDWPTFDERIWRSLLAEASSRSTAWGRPTPNAPSRTAFRPVPSGRLTLLASDRDEGAIEASRLNAERAGVADSIEFSRRALSAIEPPSFDPASRSTPLGQDRPIPGWVVTNPPYGVRVGGRQDLRNLYAQFGKVLKAKCPGWRVAMLCNSAQLQGNTGLDFDEGIPLVNGGLRVRLVKAKVPE